MTIIVDPNPAQEGQPVTVRVDQPGTYFWRVPGGEWTLIAIDPESNQGQIEVPAGSAGGNLDLSNLDFPHPDNLEVPVNAPT